MNCNMRIRLSQLPLRNQRWQSAGERLSCDTPPSTQSIVKESRQGIAGFSAGGLQSSNASSRALVHRQGLLQVSIAAESARSRQLGSAAHSHRRRDTVLRSTGADLRLPFARLGSSQTECTNLTTDRCRRDSRRSERGNSNRSSSPEARQVPGRGCRPDRSRLDRPAARGAGAA
jgi:hypothetical protein